MEVALIFLAVILGIGAIVYAGLRSPANKGQASGDSGAPVIVPGDADSGSSAGSSDGGGGGGGGGGD
jgi:hypothetical protein